MKGFERNDQLFSLCGLNCGLCPMHLELYCPGCGGGAGNQSCKIARCALEHGGLEYCFQCGDYPCQMYLNIDEFDSFISHQNQKQDMEKAQKIGLDAYRAEQVEKVRILRRLLSDYNDGRRKTFYCVAVNLLPLRDIQEVMERIAQAPEHQSLKEKSAYAVGLFQEMARKRGVELKLRKKK